MQGTGGAFILVVDDEPGIRNLLMALLRGAGYRVIAACNGREALRVCGDLEDAIDLVLSDIMMPEMSGLELAERLLASGRATRFLFMSGYAEASVQAALRDCSSGAAQCDPEVISKPFRPAEVLQRVRRALDSPYSRQL